LKRYVVKQGKNVSEQESNSEGKPKKKFAQSSINATILDTIVNKLVHDVAEPNSKKEIESKFEQRSREFLKFTRYACAKFFIKTENKFRNKNKRFLFVNLNMNSSEDFKKNTTHRAGNLKRLQS
jgi:hypothetical protein